MSAQLVEKRPKGDVTDFEDNQPEPTPTEPELPEKYRGKSPAELVRMHQEAEKLAGRHSQEVGELRAVVDDFIKSQTQLQQETQQTNQQPQKDETDNTDFFVDPRAAINKAVSEHPSVKEAEKLSRDFKKTSTLASLTKKHPDHTDILKDKAFHDWVKQSPVRQQLYAQADQQYDFSAADELFTNWKAQQPPKEEPEPKTSHDPAAVKAASTGNPTGSGEPSAKKVYRRADIIRLKQTDPKRYDALHNEIMKAYAEGRVK